MSIAEATAESGVWDPVAAATGLARSLSAGATIRRGEPLARRTTLRVGGAADIYLEPATDQDVAVSVKFCGERGVPFLVLGRGSNLLVRDGGFRGVVISLSREYFSRVEVIGHHLHCGAGARLKQVAVSAKREGLSGFEFLEGIPGSVGGGLRMNAGAMGGSIFDIVDAVRVMDRTGRMLDCAPTEMAVSYRTCGMLRDQVALSAVMRGQPAERATIERRMNEYSRKRWDSQPAAPSAGCIFKNPITVAAGRLIEELGLKGTRVGGAFVSAEHGNFIVNDGTATARDVLALIALIRQRALAEREIALETEVEIVGEESPD